MVMLLKEFHNLKHDVVTKFSVHGYPEDPRFVTLTLYHASPSALLHQREPSKVALLLTLEDADKLAMQLAGSGPKPRPAGRRRGVREQDR